MSAELLIANLLRIAKSVVGRIPRPPAAAVLDESASKIQAVLDAALARFKVDSTRPDAPAGNAAPIR